jgi:L-lactate utilization protein LutC
MNVARENILGRVRAALLSEAHRPPLPTGATVFPAVGDLEARFRQEFTAVRGEIFESPPADIADWSVTGCDCLVAMTGSIFVSTRSAGGRAASVLPAQHLVRAHRDQLVPDLPAAFALLRQRYGDHWPSAISLITGPSRTADIEKILVMGAHGPKRLAVCFASENSPALPLSAATATAH